MKCGRSVLNLFMIALRYFMYCPYKQYIIIQASYSSFHDESLKSTGALKDPHTTSSVAQGGASLEEPTWGKPTKRVRQNSNVKLLNVSSSGISRPKAFGINPNQFIENGQSTKRKKGTDYNNDQMKDPIVGSDEGGSSFGMFQTAGKKATIAISEEGLSRANKIFTTNTSIYDDDPDSSFQNTIQGPTKSSKLIVHKESIAHPPNDSCPPKMFGFQTGGSGKAITITEEQMATASKILDSSDKININEQSLVLKSTKGRDEEGQQESDFVNGGSGSSSFLPTFVTAGRESAIQVVSEEGLNVANKLARSSSTHETNQDSTQGTQLNAELDTLPGFRFAHSGKAINISEKQIDEAAKLLNSDNTTVNVHEEAPSNYSGCNSDFRSTNTDRVVDETRMDASSSPPLLPMFKTAGSHSNVAVSDEGLVKANSMFDADSDHSKAKSYLCDQNQEDEVSSLSAFPMFRTAGKSNLISISEESLGRANELFNKEAVMSSDLNMTITEAACSLSNIEQQADYGERRCLASNVPEGEHPREMTSNGAGICSMMPVGFSSAGSGTMIAVTDENLTRASELLSAKSDNRRPRQQMVDTTTVAEEGPTCLSSLPVKSSGPVVGFASAGSGASISITEESLSNAANLLSDNKNVPRLSNHNGKNTPVVESVFQTAGNKNTISISEESLSKVTNNFSKPGSLGAFATAAPPTSELNISAKSIRKSSLGQEHCNGQRYMSGFSKGGTNARITVSEESMANASHMFDSEGNNHDYTSQFMNSQRSNANDSTILGKNSGENHLLLGFTKGGSNTRITISEESMAKGDCILGSKESLENIKNDSAHILDSDPTIIGNQRVRFSLDNIQLKTRQSSADILPSTHEESEASSVTSSKTGFAFAGSSKSIRVSADSMAKANVIFEGDNKSSNEASISDSCGENINESEAFITPEEKRQLGSSHLTTRHSSSEPTTMMGKSTTPQNFVTHLNIVTDKKITPTTTASALEDLEERTSNMTSSSPQEMSLHTPLHEMTNVAHGSMQSSMKSKRLFQSSTKDIEDVAAKPISSEMDDLSSRGIKSNFSSSNYSKVTLGEFAANHNATKASSWEQCIEHGVKEVTMKITSTNATKLRFSKDDESPLFLLGQRDVPKCSHVGKSAEMKEWLIDQGCDETLITGKWVQNHCRWIIWKLAGKRGCTHIYIATNLFTVPVSHCLCHT